VARTLVKPAFVYASQNAPPLLHSIRVAAQFSEDNPCFDSSPSGTAKNGPIIMNLFPIVCFETSEDPMASQSLSTQIEAGECQQKDLLASFECLYKVFGT
jgi:hypothetical protein